MIKKIAPHATIILAVMELVFYVIEQFNTAMAFMTSKISQFTFTLLAVCAIVTAVCLIDDQIKAEKRRERRAAARRQEAGRVDRPHREPRKEA